MTKVLIGEAVTGGGTVSSPYATLADLARGVALPQFTTATRPDPAPWAGKYIRVKDPGTAEEIQTPLETSTPGVFSWVTVAVASS